MDNIRSNVAAVIQLGSNQHDAFQAVGSPRNSRDDADDHLGDPALCIVPHFLQHHAPKASTKYDPKAICLRNGSGVVFLFVQQTKKAHHIDAPFC